MRLEGLLKGKVVTLLKFSGVGLELACWRAKYPDCSHLQSPKFMSEKFERVTPKRALKYKLFHSVKIRVATLSC